MATHEFGILRRPPVHGERYDRYEPELCSRLLPVEDGRLEPLLPALEAVGCFCHTLDLPCQGLVYTGITLIPPDSLAEICEILRGIPPLEELRALLQAAAAEHRFVIHYGI